MNTQTINCAPVALFVYNRPIHTQKTIEALRKNELACHTILYVFCDGAKNKHDSNKVCEVRGLFENLDGFLSVRVHARNSNLGLAKSIISGVSEVVGKHGQVIVFEDDLVSHPGTLRYFNQLLSFYRDNSGVFSISGYSYPERTMPLLPDYEYDVYAIPRMQCWGWATWQDRWSKADFEVKDFDEFNSSQEAIDSYVHWIGKDSLNTLRSCMSSEKDVWACRWVYTHFKYHAVCMCPVKSMIDNIGHDGSGMNCGTSDRLGNDLKKPRPLLLNLPKQVFVYPGIFENFMRVVDPKRIKKSTDICSAVQRSLKKQKMSHLLTRLRLFLVSGIQQTLNFYSDKIHNACSKSSTIPLLRLGTQYGGWWVPESGLSMEDVVISAGAGEDISFDVSLSNLVGCKIIILDPTPRAKKHFNDTKSAILNGQTAPINHDPNNCYDATPNTFANLSYRNVGLWSKSTSIQFFAPENEAHVSYSIDNLHNTDSCFIAEVFTLKELMSRESIDYITILKMDVEGAEYSVIDDLLSSNIKPWFLLIEFHPGSKIENYLKIKTLFYVKKLHKSGYFIVKKNKWDYVFELQN